MEDILSKIEEVLDTSGSDIIGLKLNSGHVTFLDFVVTLESTIRIFGKGLFMHRPRAPYTLRPDGANDNSLLLISRSHSAFINRYRVAKAKRTPGIPISCDKIFHGIPIFALTWKKTYATKISTTPTILE